MTVLDSSGAATRPITRARVRRSAPDRWSPPGRLAALTARAPSRDAVVLVAYAVFVVVVIVFSFATPFSTTAPSGIPLVAPSTGHWAGTDAVGLDIFSRILVGARLSLIAAGLIIGSGVVVGALIGTVAGYVGGFLDSLLMRITDVGLALPAPVLAIAVAGAFGRSFTITLVSVAVVWWPLYARVVRGEVRAVLARPHVEAARLTNGSRWRLLGRHVLPGAFPPVLVAGSLDVGLVVLTLAALSFLGLGSPQPAPDLGGMAAQGLPNLLTAWWIPVMPSVMIALVAYGANLSGDSLRDLLQRRQGASR